MEWLAHQSMVIPGRTILPKALIIDAPDRLIYILSRMIEYVGHGLRDGSDADYLKKLLAVGAATAPYTSTPNIDIVLMRLVAGMYVQAGRAQSGRDLAEHCLQIARGDPRRSRIAWYGFADIYHRLGNLAESLVGMACALSCETEISPEEAWYETHGLIRLLRDLNMGDLARSLLPKGRELLRRFGAEEAQQHRLETIELGLRFREAAEKTPKPQEIVELIDAIARNCQTVISLHDEMTPVAILLGQAIRMGEAHGVEFRARPETCSTRRWRNWASRIRRSFARYRRDSRRPPNCNRLSGGWNPRGTPKTRAFDVRLVVIAARRLLDADEAGAHASVAAFAI